MTIQREVWAVRWPSELCSVLRRLLIVLAMYWAPLARSDKEGNPACWTEGFTYEFCCREPQGNPDCWDGVHTYQTCCFGNAAGDSFNLLLERGRQGDASVLPRLMKFLSAGGDTACSAAALDVSPQLRCLGTRRGLTENEWRAFFDAHSLSKFVRLQQWPDEAEPWSLFKRCCLSGDASDVIAEMVDDCAFGTVTLLLSSIGHIEHHVGRSEARRLYDTALDIVEKHRQLEDQDCHWRQQVNHVAFQHYEWFMSKGAARFPPRFPCGANVNIFVDEASPLEALHAHPLMCAVRGLCFTEVWIHQFLRHSSCRVLAAASADFHFIPAYTSCYDLHVTKTELHEQALGAEALLDVIDKAARPHSESSKSVERPILVTMTCEKWKLRGLRERLHQARSNGNSGRITIAAVEAKPLVELPCDEDDQSSISVPNAHCEDCFDSMADVVIPSAVLPTDAARLRSFAKQPEQRELVAMWHGEHAKSASRADVAQGYLDVNETVRLAILESFREHSDVSVGPPTLRYAFLMGNAHFCLIPRGRGWWTVRLFESFYSGCIPVILSDDQRLPFEEFLDWERFSIKWPMKRVGEGLYEHLRLIVAAMGSDQRLASLHAGVREVACWFDYHAPENAECSPYIGFMRQLEHRTSASKRVAPLWTHSFASASQSPMNSKVSRFWF